MNRYDQFVRQLWGVCILLCCILVGCLIWAAVDAGKLIRKATVAVENIDRAAYTAGAAAADLQKTLALERKSAQSQIDQATQTTRDLDAAAKDVEQLVADTDSSLNDMPVPGTPTGLLPQLSITVAAQNEHLAAIESQAQQNLADLDSSEKQLAPAIDNFNAASASLALNLPGILRNVQDTTAQTVTIGKNLSGTTDAMDASAHDIQAFVHRETTPVRGTWHVVKGFLDSIAGPAAQVATSVK